MSSMKQSLGYLETFPIANCLNQRDDIVLGGPMWRLVFHDTSKGLSCLYFEVSFLHTGAKNKAIEFRFIPCLTTLC